MTNIGDIYHRPYYGDHWLITGIKIYKNDIYQFSVYNLESGREETYTNPFGDSLPDVFVLVA